MIWLYLIDEIRRIIMKDALINAYNFVVVTDMSLKKYADLSSKPQKKSHEKLAHSSCYYCIRKRMNCMGIYVDHGHVKS